jgi:threonine dehydrogenase-like Zn-dependent dehydrogenase
MDVLRRAELTLLGAQTCPRPVFQRVIELMAAGHYPAERWVEHLPLSDVVTGLTDIRDGRRGKVLVDLSSVR